MGIQQISKESHILLTGATGFLGQYLYRAFCGKGYNVIPTSSRGQSGYKKLDLTQDSVDLEIDQSIHAVVHNAGFIKGSHENLSLVNTQGTKRIIQHAKELGVQRLIFISSIDTIIDNEFVNNTSYAKSKREAEEYVKQSGLQWAIIRPSVIFGPDTKNFGQLEAVIKKLPFIPLPHGGKYIWQPVFVEDLAKEVVAITTATEINLQVNFVGPENLRFSEIVEVIEKHIGTHKMKIAIPTWMMGFISKLVGVISEDAHNNFFSRFGNKILNDKDVRRCPTSLATYYSNECKVTL